MRSSLTTPLALLLFLPTTPACGETSDGGETEASTSSTADGDTDGSADDGGEATSEGDATEGDATEGDTATTSDGDDDTSTGDGDGDGDGDFTPIDEARVIFSGHSLMDVAVPTVRTVAAAQGDDLIDLFQTIPGSPIRVRTRGSNPTSENSWEGYAEGTGGINLVDELRSPTLLPAGEVYDTLVITDRHDLLGVVQWESTVSLLRHFHDRLLEGNPNGQTYFYHSWLDIDKADPQVWIDYERAALTAWECVSSKVNLTLEADGLSPTLRTIPAGWAMTNLVEAALSDAIAGLSGSQQEVLDAIFSDNVHLTPLGSFYIGAFTYASVFHKSPEGVQAPPEVATETGDALLALAWLQAQDYAARPGAGEHTMDACRAHISDAVCPPFWGAMLGEPGNVAGCQSFFGDDAMPGNPFRWPDPDLETWPIP